MHRSQTAVDWSRTDALFAPASSACPTLQATLTKTCRSPSRIIPHQILTLVICFSSVQSLHVYMSRENRLDSGHNHLSRTSPFILAAAGSLLSLGRWPERLSFVEVILRLFLCSSHRPIAQVPCEGESMILANCWSPYAMTRCIR